MFQAWDFLSAATYEKLAERKAFSPTEIETEATKRLPPQQLPTELVLAAADHNARMITAYRNNPICLGQRREYLARLVRMLLSHW